MKVSIGLWVVALITACVGGSLELTTMGIHNVPVLVSYTIALTCLATTIPVALSHRNQARSCGTCEVTTQVRAGTYDCVRDGCKYPAKTF